MVTAPSVGSCGRHPGRVLPPEFWARCPCGPNPRRVVQPSLRPRPARQLRDRRGAWDRTHGSSQHRSHPRRRDHANLPITRSADILALALVPRRHLVVLATAQHRGPGLPGSSSHRGAASLDVLGTGHRLRNDPAARGSLMAASVARPDLGKAAPRAPLAGGSTWTLATALPLGCVPVAASGSPSKATPSCGDRPVAGPRGTCPPRKRRGPRAGQALTSPATTPTTSPATSGPSAGHALR